MNFEQKLGTDQENIKKEVADTKEEILKNDPELAAVAEKRKNSIDNLEDPSTYQTKRLQRRENSLIRAYEDLKISQERVSKINEELQNPDLSQEEIDELNKSKERYEKDVEFTSFDIERSKEVIENAKEKLALLNN